MPGLYEVKDTLKGQMPKVKVIQHYLLPDWYSRILCPVAFYVIGEGVYVVSVRTNQLFAHSC